jgi:2'-5' RNA ligase
MAEPIRSFLAFDINNESVLKRMTEAQILIVKTAADLKLVDPKNIHVTVRFLGNVTQDMIEKIYAEMKSVQFVPFNIKICGLGAFPDMRYPRVCWAGITEGSTELRGIFSQLEPRLQGLGFPAEPRGFSPHLTIARVRSGRNKAELTRVIKENVNFDFGVIKGECLKLKKSELTPRGPIYSTLKEFSPTG